jgi:hypothetical protein
MMSSDNGNRSLMDTPYVVLGLPVEEATPYGGFVVESARQQPEEALQDVKDFPPSAEK